MPKESRQSDAATGAEHAMHQVLEAEELARQAVNNCAQQADARLREARATAKRIVERADQRISLIRQRTHAALAAEIDQLERDQVRRAAEFDSSAVDMEAVAAAVEQLVDRLTSGSD